MRRACPGITPNITPGLVEEVGYIGHMSAYRVRLADGRVIRVTQSNRLRDEDPIWLTVLNHGGAAVVVGLYLLSTNGSIAVSIDQGMWLLAFGAIQMAVPYLLLFLLLRKKIVAFFKEFAGAQG